MNRTAKINPIARKMLSSEPSPATLELSKVRKTQFQHLWKDLGVNKQLSKWMKMIQMKTNVDTDTHRPVPTFQDVKTITGKKLDPI